MRSRFQQGLDELRDKLLRMGGLAEQAIDRATEAYRTRDAKFCQMVFTGETAINQAERDIDELALDLLAMQQPMAIDLRFIMAIIKINADLERVGDQAVNIAQRVLDLISEPPVELPVDVPKMASSVSTMVQRSLQAFLDGHAEVAESVLQMDNVVDRMKDESFVVLVQKMQSDPALTRPALNVLLIARNLERIADHATNIAEDVIFWVRGADVRHGGAHYPY
jgi:phosphate transport system protein